MTVGRTLRHPFSPFAIGFVGFFIEWLLGAAALWALAADRDGLSLYLFAGFVGAPFVFRRLSKCLRCGKSAMVEDEGGLSKHEFARRRYRPLLWPETECSQCGADLTSRLG